MHVLWLAKGAGTGHATRAAAITRWMHSDVTVVTDSYVPFYITGKKHAVDNENSFIVRNLKPDLIVMDQFQRNRFDKKVWDIIMSHDVPRVLLRRETGRHITKEPRHELEIDVESGVVILARDEMWPRSMVRQAWSVPSHKSLAFVADHAPHDTLDTDRWHIAHVGYAQFPIVRYMEGVDYLFGWAGCNLVAEAEITCTPSRFSPRRHTTDQLARASRLIPSRVEPRGPVPDFRNRAQEIAFELDSWFIRADT